MVAFAILSSRSQCSTDGENARDQDKHSPASTGKNMARDGRKETSVGPPRLGAGSGLSLAAVAPPSPMVLVAVVHFCSIGRSTLSYEKRKRWASIISVHLETQISAVQVAEISCAS